jgi:hypothetical protein
MSRAKFRATHKIIVPGCKACLTIPVMLLQGDLWQGGEYLSGAPFPMWKLIEGQLEYRHGAVPAGTIVRAMAEDPDGGRQR